MDVERRFPTKIQGKRKKHFDELNDETEELQLSAIQEFKVSYFLVIIDATIASLTSRFEQLQKFEKYLVSYSTRKNLKSLDDNDLRKCCTNFVVFFSRQQG